MSGPDSSRARVLVVDDLEPNRDVLALRVRRLGHEALLAEHGREALELLRHEPVDLVLLDIMMPEMDGYQVLEHIKTDEHLRDIPVIMISAVDEVDAIVRCIDLGADDYLPKPFNPVILRARIDASLARKRLREREQQYARTLERELEIGRNIQRSFLPAALPEVPGYDLAAVLEPARQVAGDFYDAYAIGGGQRAVLAVGDVCDKGVGAALFMALFRSLLRTGVEQAFAGAHADAAAVLAEVVRSTNDYIAHTHGDTNMFATLVLAVLETGSGRLTYVNGGHEPPLLLRSGRCTGRLGVTGPAVGLMPDLPFAVATCDLEPATVMVAYTDGVPEARSPAGDVLGEARLVAAAQNARGSAAEVRQAIHDAVREFAGAAPQADDLTLLVLRRAG